MTLCYAQFNPLTETVNTDDYQALPAGKVWCRVDAPDLKRCDSFKGWDQLLVGMKLCSSLLAAVTLAHHFADVIWHALPPVLAPKARK